MCNIPTSVYLQYAHHQKFSFHVSSYRWSPLPIFALPQPYPFLSGNHYSILCICALVFLWFGLFIYFLILFIFFHPRMSDIILHFSFTISLISLSVTYVVGDGKISSFIWLSSMPLCMYLYHMRFLYPLMAVRLLP